MDLNFPVRLRGVSNEAVYVDPLQVAAVRQQGNYTFLIVGNIEIQIWEPFADVVSKMGWDLPEDLT